MGKRNRIRLNRVPEHAPEGLVDLVLHIRSIGHIIVSLMAPVRMFVESIRFVFLRVCLMFRSIVLVNKVFFFGKLMVELLQGHKVCLRFSQILILPLSLYFYRVHRAVLSAGRRLSKPVCDGFDGIVAVTDRFGAVVEGEPLIKGRILSRLKGLAAAGNLARRNSAREVVDQTSNIRMAFVLNLPDIDVRVVLSQLQMRQQRPITPNNMLTILAVHPPRFDFPKPELRSQSRLGVLK